MIYVGIDVSSKSFVVRATDEKRREVYKAEIAPTSKGLEKAMQEIGTQKKLVIFEAGNQMKWIALWFKRRRDVQLHVVHPNEVKWISQCNGKTDKVDARKLSELGRGGMLPMPVHVVEGEMRELRELLSARQALQSKRVALINTLRAYALQEGKQLPEKYFERGDWYAALLKSKLSKTFCLIAQSFRQSIEALKDAEGELTAQIVSVEDERIEQLESIPSIGKISSRVLVSAIDDATRFGDRKKIANYGGLAPTIYQSGGEVHLGHINRDGRREIRRVLLQCAHTLARMTKSYSAAPLLDFYHRLLARRGKKIAIVALARKLLTIAYGVLKSGTTYEPMKLLPPMKVKRAVTYLLQPARG